MKCRIQDTVMPACPETASIKHHSEVSIYSPIYTFAYRHNMVGTEAHIREKMVVGPAHTEEERETIGRTKNIVI